MADQPQPAVVQTQEDQAYNAILMAQKGQLACENERKKFALCRATKVGRSKDPSFCETQAADFLQCYQEMNTYVKLNCQTQYLEAYDCLREADSKSSLTARLNSMAGFDARQVAKCERAMTNLKMC